MKMNRKFVLAAVAALSLTSVAQAQTKDMTVDAKAGVVVPYAVDSRGVLLRSGTGLCWRTGYWSLDAAKQVKVKETGFPVACACEPDLVPKELCTAPVAAPAAAPAPAAQPAPVAPPPAAAPAPVAQKVTVNADALFEFDKAVISSEGQSKLSSFVDSVKGINLEVVIAVGHADRIGTEKYNQALSEKRAAAIKDFLIGKGIEANRVYTEGKGESQPVTGDKCTKMGAENGRNRKLVDCLAADRRVDLEAVGTQK